MRALYIRRMHEDPRYENKIRKPQWVHYTGVTCKKEYTYTWCSMATREERLTVRNRRERDRLRRQMETAEEGEARFINALIMNDV